LFSLLLLWQRREMISPLPTGGSWWGLAFFPAWIALRWGAGYFRVLVWDPLSLLPFFAGVAVFVGGWRALRWAWPAIVYLVFILPLPGFIDSMLRFDLQRLATIASVFVLQTIGVPTVAEGNVINLTSGPLEVAEVCSGLRMLMLFFAVCVGAALLLRAPLWEKLVTVFSAIPIAVISNVARVAVTAIIRDSTNIGPESFDTVHKYVGLLMPPCAILLLWGEMTLLRKLFGTEIVDRPLLLGGGVHGGPRGPVVTVRPGRRA
jgi:exosortase